jgi:plastocyanin
MLSIPSQLPALLTAAALAIAGFVPDTMADTGSSAGRFEGRVLAGASVGDAKKLSVAIDAWVCAPGGETADPTLVIGKDRGLANVVVRVNVPDATAVQGGLEVLIDQEGCVFTPHVVVVAPGQTLRVKNSDKVLHNFRTITAHNRAINKAQIGGKEDAFVFNAPEVIRAECDVHYWMSAIVVVKPHEFLAVTDAEGRFSIDGLAPGTYEVELWHERLGTKEAAVTVGDEGGLLLLTWEKSGAQPQTEQ